MTPDTKLTMRQLAEMVAAIPKVDDPDEDAERACLLTALECAFWDAARKGGPIGACLDGENMVAIILAASHEEDEQRAGATAPAPVVGEKGFALFEFCEMPNRVRGAVVTPTVSRVYTRSLIDDGTRLKALEHKDAWDVWAHEPATTADSATLVATVEPTGRLTMHPTNDVDTTVVSYTLTLAGYRRARHKAETERSEAIAAYQAARRGYDNTSTKLSEAQADHLANAAVLSKADAAVKRYR